MDDALTDAAEYDDYYVGYCKHHPPSEPGKLPPALALTRTHPPCSVCTDAVDGSSDDGDYEWIDSSCSSDYTNWYSDEPESYKDLEFPCVVSGYKW